MAINKMKLGIDGLDTTLNTGLISGFSYFLNGLTGSEKTILSTQWLLNSNFKNEVFIFINLAEQVSKLKSNIESFGWVLHNIFILDLSLKTFLEKMKNINFSARQGGIIPNMGNYICGN